MPDAEKIRRLLQSIKEARFRKTIAGLKAIDGNPLRINMLSFMEINEIRPFLLRAMDQAARLSLLEAEERARRQAAYGGGRAGDLAADKGPESQDPFSSYAGPRSDDVNPYTPAYNPYAYSSVQ